MIHAQTVDFLIEVMVSFFERQQSQKEAINALPLYPNEQIMWDESLVPSINYTGEGCLALPKLNLQFLTLHDYFLRNVNLFRLESTYEIREDIQEAVPHLLAYINNEGEPAFRGWSRMTVPVKEFKITEVEQPNIGEVKPAAVTAEVTFSISSYKSQISAEEAANATVQQRLVVGAIISGVQPGLSMVVGPPGTGKTDTAVLVLNVLYHNCPSQRTLIITHSNQDLNDLSDKIMQGEQELASDLDFSSHGRVNAMLVRRLELFSEVERLARSLRLPEDVGYTCETAGYFWLLHVYSRWEQFLAACTAEQDNPTIVQDKFPFKEFFSDTPQPVFTGQSFGKDMRSAKGCFRHLKTMFQELEECRAIELLKSTVDRSNYLITKHAKIVAMTCTHAALKRKDFLQRQEDGYARLKRCILIGDHHQLPPVVKNMAFQKYSHMDQSLFTRFVRLGIPYIELNAQGRARLYNWRYRELGDLPYVKENAVFHKANA
ncbi:hypothetical protein KY290_031108 [Solanum tuberosum]|uniref:Intron-binding protein aquarius n=1 Tax=Solanum tuberosum TaxID=4113 RepID=A0ABQ7U8D4_SOLTU|nr:hypothetical protein KY290_031108 [Solanum tuberosum]